MLVSCSVLCKAQSAQSPFAFQNTLMPEPSSLQTGQGYLALTPGFAATTDKFHDQRLDQAIERAMSQLKQQTGVRLSVHLQSASGANRPVFVISVDGPGEKVQSVDENESYSLTVTSQSVHLRAATDVGAMHGLQTLLQLVQHTDTQYFLPAVTIHDSPRFPWRGLMLDCSRHFEPIPVIKRTLDAMAAVKMNVFHWHLSDDQGFRIQSKVFPLLTQRGSDGDFYTQAQAREIVAYARARGIRVVPEFDMPGHTSSWFVGYPSLASAPGPFHIERHFGIFDPVMDPTRESTYVFLNKFIAEMAGIFPDPYMHIGGDENNGVEWKHNPRIQAFMRAHHLQGTAGLQAYFNRRLLKILQKYHKHMIGWDEVLAPGLPKDVMIQSWRGYDSLAAAARKGYTGILSSGYYLDSMQTAAQHYAVDPIPLSSTLTPQQRKRILGGEACMWGEYVDAGIIDSRVWPITAAIAERLWSAQSVNNVNDMYRRLRVESLRLEALGLTQISQEDASLRQLADTEDIAKLKVLAATLEPATFDQRDQYTLKHDITQQTPLDHLVDALRPDPPFRHDFKLLVQSYLERPDANSKPSQHLRLLMESWVTQKSMVSNQMRQSPRLFPALVRSTQLAQMGSMGLQAIGYLSVGKIPPPGWEAAQLALLKQAAEPVDLTRFDVIQPMRMLVEAASGKTVAKGAQ
uniref:Glycosyl hydrolase n=1 Tax=Acidobacterium capsulatum TaxID=33075 RepID=A0A7V4XQ82_9BACT